MVIVAIGMVAIVSAVGLVIDGGFLWGQQRDTQNGTDASAEAGAVQLMQVLRGELTLAEGAVAVCGEVKRQATNNAIEVHSAYYTDLSGARMAVAVDTDGTCRPIPACAPPTCAGDFASGVEVQGRRTATTFLMHVVGFDQVRIATAATAISGYITNPCADQEACTLLPITPSVNVVQCNRQNRPVTQDADGDKKPDVHQAPSDLVVLPFCRTASGSIGWLDWDGGGGGAAEIEQEIRNPTGVWEGPGWYQIAQTGDINSSQIEAAINEYTNQVVYIPMFDGYCSFDPTPNKCPEGDSAGGKNIWYHLPQLAAFQLLDPRDPDGSPPRSAWITGNDAEIKAVCGTESDSGATSCLTGRFVDIITTGPVGALPTDGSQTSTFYGIQLIH